MAGAFDQLNERMLIARCQAGDHFAFEEIVARYQPRLTFYVRKLVRNSGTVDDLLGSFEREGLRVTERRIRRTVYASRTDLLFLEAVKAS